MLLTLLFTTYHTHFFSCAASTWGPPRLTLSRSSGSALQAAAAAAVAVAMELPTFLAPSMAGPALAAGGWGCRRSCPLTAPLHGAARWRVRRGPGVGGGLHGLAVPGLEQVVLCMA